MVILQNNKFEVIFTIFFLCFGNTDTIYYHYKYTIFLTFTALVSGTVRQKESLRENLPAGKNDPPPLIALAIN